MTGGAAAAAAGKEVHDHTSELREDVRDTVRSGRQAERATAADERQVAKHNKQADRQYKKMDRQVEKMERHAQRQMEAEEAAARAADRLAVAKEVLAANQEAAAAAEVGQHSSSRSGIAAAGGAVDSSGSMPTATGATSGRRDPMVDDEFETAYNSSSAKQLAMEPTTAFRGASDDDVGLKDSPPLAAGGGRTILPPGHPGAPGVVPAPGEGPVTPGLTDGGVGAGAGAGRYELPAGQTGSELERPSGLHPAFEESGGAGLLHPQQHLAGEELVANRGMEDDSPRRKKGLLGTLKQAFTRPRDTMQVCSWAGLVRVELMLTGRFWTQDESAAAAGRLSNHVGLLEQYDQWQLHVPAVDQLCT